MVKKILKLLCMICVLIGSLMGIIGCGNKVQPTSNNDNKNHPVVIKLEGGDWGLSNPFKHYPRGPGGYKMEFVYDSLLEKDEKGLIPWMAKDYEVSKDGKEYTFTLRDNIKWHDGEKLTPEDVKFSFEYYKKHPPVWNGLLVNEKYIIDKIEIDNNVIKIKTNSPNATYLNRIGTMPIIPKHVWEKVEDPVKYDGKGKIVGCGPYVLDSYSSDKGTYKFKAFKDYWGPKQKVEAIEYVPVSDPVLAFENGDIDLLTASADILSRYKDKKEFKITQNKPFFGYRLILNMEKRPELKDINLRKVLAYGINRQEMVDKVARGSGIVASMAYLPKGHVWYNDNIEKYDYNAEKAKELLKGKKYTFELLTGNTPQEVKIAELIKISLEKVGIEVNVKSVDMKTRDSSVKKGNFQLAITRHGGWGNDADSLRGYYGSNNPNSAGSPASGALPGYYNKEIYQLCQKQMTQLNLEDRKKSIFKLQELIAKDVPMIPLYNTIDNFVTRPSKYDGWMFRYDHNYMEHCKLSYLEREVRNEK